MDYKLYFWKNGVVVFKCTKHLNNDNEARIYCENFIKSEKFDDFDFES